MIDFYDRHRASCVATRDARTLSGETPRTSFSPNRSFVLVHFKCVLVSRTPLSAPAQMTANRKWSLFLHPRKCFENNLVFLNTNTSRTLSGWLKTCTEHFDKVLFQLHIVNPCDMYSLVRYSDCDLSRDASTQRRDTSRLTRATQVRPMIYNVFCWWFFLGSRRAAQNHVLYSFNMSARGVFSTLHYRHILVRPAIGFTYFFAIIRFRVDAMRNACARSPGGLKHDARARGSDGHALSCTKCAAVPTTTTAHHLSLKESSFQWCVKGSYNRKQRANGIAG